MVLVAHVSDDVQCATGVQLEHCVAAPLLSAYVPVLHVAHCELLAVVQVGDTAQLATAVQAGHEVPPADRYRPLLHEVHCELADVVHVSDDVQPVTAVHAGHVVGTVAAR